MRGSGSYELVFRLERYILALVKSMYGKGKERKRYRQVFYYRSNIVRENVQKAKTIQHVNVDVDVWNRRNYMIKITSFPISLGHTHSSEGKYAERKVILASDTGYNRDIVSTTINIIHMHIPFRLPDRVLLTKFSEKVTKASRNRKYSKYMGRDIIGLYNGTIKILKKIIRLMTLIRF